MMDVPKSETARDRDSAGGAQTIARLLDALAEYLRRGGYSTYVCTQYHYAARHFLTWRGHDAAEVVPFAEADVSVFVTQHLPECHCPRPRGDSQKAIRAALGHLVSVARGEGQLVSPADPGPATPIEQWLAAFVEHLRAVRGLAPPTCAHQARYVREFLTVTFGDTPPVLQVLTAPTLITFIASKASTAGRPTAKHATTALRNFLRFLALRGVCEPGLAATVPTVPNWSARFLPKGLPDVEVQRLLYAIDTVTPTGRRDHAITLSMLRLGLRAGEVAQLTLGDLDWREGTLRLAVPKERRASVLPLPSDVGMAIVSYICDGRPASADRHVFLTHKTPMGRAMSPTAVCGVVRRAWRRAGITGSGRGAHVLRHTLAGQMVRAGTTMKEVADVLRHRHLDTTTVYAKVDLTTLVKVALPWPEVAP